MAGKDGHVTRRGFIRESLRMTRNATLIGAAGCGGLRAKDAADHNAPPDVVVNEGIEGAKMGATAGAGIGGTVSFARLIMGGVSAASDYDPMRDAQSRARQIEQRRWEEERRNREL